MDPLSCRKACVSGKTTGAAGRCGIACGPWRRSRRWRRSSCVLPLHESLVSRRLLLRGRPPPCAPRSAYPGETRLRRSEVRRDVLGQKPASTPAGSAMVAGTFAARSGAGNVPVFPGSTSFPPRTTTMHMTGASLRGPWPEVAERAGVPQVRIEPIATRSSTPNVFDHGRIPPNAMCNIRPRHEIARCRACSRQRRRDRARRRPVQEFVDRF